jgi:hypothetical protein
MFAALLLAVLPVSAKTNSGETIEGNLVGFSSNEVRIEASGQVREIPFDDLTTLSPTSVNDRSGPMIRVTLVNGSKIAAQEISLSNNELMIEPRRQQPLRVPVKQVKAVRFRAASTATDAKWLGIVGQESRGDTLVIRRGQDRLDPQSGVIEAIADGKVVFDLDGDKVNAPIDRLEGIVFGGTDVVSENSEIRVIDVFGSQWMVAAIQPSNAEEPLTIRLSDRLTHPVPLDHIESIRWSGGLVLLAAQPPASSSVNPYFQTALDKGLIEKFFAPKATSDGDLLTAGGSSIEYRIDPGYQTLSGTAQRLASIRDGSKLNVQITLDGQTVWEQELVDAQPRGFELPVGDARRLAIIVNNGDDGDLGDTVRIVRPRLTK